MKKQISKTHTTAAHYAHAVAGVATRACSSLRKQEGYDVEFLGILAEALKATSEVLSVMIAGQTLPERVATERKIWMRYKACKHATMQKFCADSKYRQLCILSNGKMVDLSRVQSPTPELKGYIETLCKALDVNYPDDWEASYSEYAIQDLEQGQQRACWQFEAQSMMVFLKHAPATIIQSRRFVRNWLKKQCHIDYWFPGRFRMAKKDRQEVVSDKEKLSAHVKVVLPNVLLIDILSEGLHEIASVLKASLQDKSPFDFAGSEVNLREAWVNFCFDFVPVAILKFAHELDKSLNNQMEGAQSLAGWLSTNMSSEFKRSIYPRARNVSERADTAIFCGSFEAVLSCLNNGEHLTLSLLRNAAVQNLRSFYSLKEHRYEIPMEAHDLKTLSERFIAPTLEEAFIEKHEAYRHASAITNATTKLSNREAMVYDLLVKEYSVAAISEKLGITRSTVDVLIHRLRKKLKVYTP